MIEQYLEVVSLPLLFLGTLGAVFMLVLVPQRLRLEATLGLMVIWLGMGQLLDLQFIQAPAKVTAPAAFLLVAIAAMLDHTPKRQLNLASFIYVLMAVVSPIFVITTVDRDKAFVVRFNWLMLVIAAITVARLLVDERSMLRVIWGLTWGLMVTNAIMASALFLDVTELFGHGIGRFQPWGSPGNQSGIVFVMTAYLALYLATRRENRPFVPILLASSALAGLCGLLTASRQIVGLIAVLVLPILMRMIGRPVVAVTLVAAVAGGTLLVSEFFERSQTERLTGLGSGRYEIFAEYMPIIAERPIFGLLGSSGEYSQKEETIGNYAHNAYLDMLYMGGFTYALPMFLMVLLSSFAAIRVWFSRKRLQYDPLLTTLLVLTMLMIHAHGMVTTVTYGFGYSWAFFHIMLATHFLTLQKEISAAGQTA